MKHLPLIFIVGPTAVGKTQTALLLAERLNAEIVSCDAMQVYREIAIVNDKPSVQARARVAHHCVDIVSVTQDFNVARYRQSALEAIATIEARGKRPLIVGGSGMYMTVLLDGIFEDNSVREDIRASLIEESKAQGPLSIHARLRAVDGIAAAKIHPQDVQRSIRALAVFLSTGESITCHQQKRIGLWGHRPLKIYALHRPRASLYQRVQMRVAQMFDQGLEDEIAGIADLSLSPSASKIIGIPEVLAYLNNEHDLAHAQYLIQRNTRHYVKRQLTWLRRDPRIEWVDIAEDVSLEAVVEDLSARIEGL